MILILAVALLVLGITMYVIFLVKAKDVNSLRKIDVAYVNDEMVLEKALKGSYNQVFKTSDNVSSIISHYIIRKEKNKKTVAFEYTTEAENLNFNVIAFDKKQRIIDVFVVKIHKEFVKTLEVPKHTQYINIVISSQAEQEQAVFNLKESQAKSFKKLIVLSSFAMFSVIFPLNYFVLRLATGSAYIYFLNVGTISILFVATTITTIIYDRFMRKYFKKIVKRMGV